MSLTQHELDRIRYESGANVLRIGSEPYVTFQAIFSRVILPYTTDVGSTSTSTIAAVTAGADASVTVLANPLGQDTATVAFAPGVAVVVDVGPSQEFATVRSVSGLTLILSTLSNAHGAAAAPYPVNVKGSEWIVRDILTRLDAINAELSSTAVQGAGTAAVDEIKLHASLKGGRDQRDRFDALIVQRMNARDDLCSAIGLPNQWRAKPGGQGPTRYELY